MRKLLTDAGASMARRAWYSRQNGALAAPRRDNGRRRLLVDVSLIARSDARTGIQRVVRGVWVSLLQYAGEIEIVPVSASRHRGYSPLQSSDEGRFELVAASADPIEVRQGDIFLGLDLSAHLLPAHTKQIEQWKALGVTIAIVCYDLLPRTNPQFFTSRTCAQFNRWITWVLRTADMIFGISDDVLTQIRQELDGLGTSKLPTLHKLSLGADLLESAPSLGVRASDRALIELVKGQPAILMVGTIEPRKGYSVALNAFEKLWADEEACHLVIVGKVGWKSHSLISRLRNHPQRDKRLHWVEGASDEVLDQLYRSCRGLLVTAYAEGYCLPVAEAARHGLPVLARDIAVLREHSHAKAHFFNHESDLPAAVEDFIKYAGPGDGPGEAPTWGDCGSRLVGELGLLPPCENTPSTCNLPDGPKVPVAMNDPMEKNPDSRAQNLADLLHWDDKDFIQCAYLTLLGRQPDHVGERHFLAKLRQGHAKEEILSLLRASREGQKHDPGIAGLDRALKRAALARRPVVGRILRLFWRSLEGDSKKERRTRALLNTIAMNQKSLAELRDAVDLALTAASPLAAPESGVHDRWREGDPKRPTSDAPDLARLKIYAPLQNYFRETSV